jgi:hypothetical protein
VVEILAQIVGTHRKGSFAAGIVLWGDEVVVSRWRAVTIARSPVPQMPPARSSASPTQARFVFMARMALR